MAAVVVAPDELDVLRRIAAERGDTPIILMAAEIDVPMTVQAMKAGAVEFSLKPLADSELLGAIENAIARSSAVVAHEVSELRRRYDSLNVREARSHDARGGRPT